MKVNPYYKGKQWPVPSAQFEHARPVHLEGRHPRSATPKPVMEQVAQFVYDLGRVATP